MLGFTVGKAESCALRLYFFAALIQLFAGLCLASPEFFEKHFAGVREVRVEWDPDLALGIAGIDRQHQELFRRINVFGENLERNRQTLDDMLDFMISYVVIHFTDEESLMKEEGYPKLEPHRRQHQVFIEMIDRARNEAARDTEYTWQKLQEFMYHWLVNHIGQVDKELGGYLTKKSTD